MTVKSIVRRNSIGKQLKKLARASEIVNNSVKKPSKTASILHTLFHTLKFILLKFFQRKKSKQGILVLPLTLAKENSHTLLVSLLCMPGRIFTWFSLMAYISIGIAINRIKHIKRNPSRNGKGSLHGSRYLSSNLPSFEGTLHPNSTNSRGIRNNIVAVVSRPPGFSETRFQRINNNLRPGYAGLGSSFC
jgi:hypothetical protein